MLRDVLIQKGLSNREAEVAELVTKGLSNKEVANQLFVTEKTVKFHLTNIYKKMNLKSRAQLIVWCMPHQNFVEDETRINQNPAGQQINAETNTIPSGNRTVGTPIGSSPIGTPSAGNSGNDQGNNGGNQGGGFSY